jgi:DNA repair exonuclease SbcCD nuclease subunit
VKIGILSDLHLEFRPLYLPAVFAEDASVLPYIGLPESAPEGMEALVLAGDIHPGQGVRSALLRLLRRAYPGVDIIMALGNHDHYGTTYEIGHGIETLMVGGKKFAVATLWTHLRPMDMITARTFGDFHQITGLTPAIWNHEHAEQKRLLIEAEADVVVTHHTPSQHSISASWKGHLLNPFFANDLDFMDFPQTKLWVHGHVHDTFDYTIERGGNVGGIRVVCQPFGYPFEKHCFGRQMKLIEA